MYSEIGKHHVYQLSNFMRLVTIPRKVTFSLLLAWSVLNVMSHT